MLQATGINTNLRISFADLNNTTNFSSKSPQRVFVLVEVVRIRVPNASASRWNSEIRIINIVYRKREAFIDYVEKIQTSSRR